MALLPKDKGGNRSGKEREATIPLPHLLSRLSPQCLPMSHPEGGFVPRAAGETVQVDFYALAATRRKSTALMLTPGAAQLVAGGADRRACSSVANTTNAKPSPSTGSSQ
jgi:hypothetical protein